MNTISSAVAKLASMNLQIAALASEQNYATEEININSTAINTVAQGIVKDSEVITNSSHEMEQLLGEMDSLVRKFTV